MKMQITEATENRSFTDCCKFFGAKLYGIHDILPKDNGDLEVQTTMRMTGPLAFFWWRVIGKGIVASLPQQTDLMIDCAKKKR